MSKKALEVLFFMKRLDLWWVFEKKNLFRLLLELWFDWFASFWFSDFPLKVVKNKTTWQTVNIKLILIIGFLCKPMDILHLSANIGGKTMTSGPNTVSYLYLVFGKGCIMRLFNALMELHMFGAWFYIISVGANALRCTKRRVCLMKWNAYNLSGTWISF